MAVMKKMYAIAAMILILVLNLVVLAQDETRETQLVLTNKNVCVNNVQSSCVLVLSSYLDNCLVDTCFINVEGNADVEYDFSEFVDFTYSYEEVDTVKAFLLSCVNRLQPVCESKSVEIREPEMLVFTLLEDDTYSVRAGRDIADYETVEIPEMYNSKPVTQIEANGFNNVDTIKSVNIPDTVTIIGNSAFYGCVGLETVYLSKSLETINQNAFRECLSLATITIPSSVTRIESYAFYNAGLTNANIENWNMWSLENEIIVDANGGKVIPLDGVNFSSKKYVNTTDYYSYDNILINENSTANALTGTFSLTIYKTVKKTWYDENTYEHTEYVKTVYSTKEINFYTENWIKS